MSVSTSNYHHNLSSKHYKECVEERGLSLLWILVNGRSLSAEEASLLLGYTAKSDGLLLKGESRQIQFKPDKPWKSEADKLKKIKKAPKYRSPIGSYDVMLPIHPDNPHYWSDIEALKERCWKVEGKPCLLLTEGMFKAIALCSHSIPALAVLGVEMGLTPKDADPQGKRYLVLTLEKLAQSGFGVIIVYDADGAHNINVKKAEYKLANQLRKFNVPVYSLTGAWAMEDGKGVDDFIKNKGIDAFRQILQNQLNSEFDSSIFESKKPGQPKPNEVARNIADKYREKLAWNIQIREWFQYERKQPGIWAKAPKEGVEQVVRAELDVLCIEDGYDYRYLTNIINLLKSELMVEEWNQNTGLIPLQNGCLNKETRELLPHYPGYRLTHCLPFNYNPEATCEPITKWLRETVGGKEDLVEFLLAYLNAVINQRSDLQCYLELIGPGGTGKSTFMNLASALVGRNNTAITKHQLLETSRFEAAKLANKLLTLVTEADQYVGSVNVLKALTGQDQIAYEEKMKQPGEGFIYKGMVIVAGNEAPKSSDYTSGLQRRRRSIHFKNHIPTHRRRDLDAEFKPYLPGLLNLVLAIPDQRVTELIRDADIHCPSIRQYQRETLVETNPIADWLDNRILRSPDSRCTPGLLYQSYTNYCDQTGMKPISMKRFSSLLPDLCNVQLGWHDVEKGRDRLGRYVKGLQLRADNDFNSPYPISEALSVTHQSDMVTDCVTAGTQTVNGCDGCDGFFESAFNNEENFAHQNSSPYAKESENEVQSVTPDIQSVEPSHSEHSESVTGCETPQTQSVTPVTSSHNKGSSDSQPIENTPSNAICRRRQRFAIAKKEALIESITLIQQRLGWGLDEVRECLIQRYKKRSRHYLSDSELQDYLQYLRERSLSLLDLEENIADLTSDLKGCDSKECLQALRITEGFTPERLKKASQRLTPEKYQQIKEWVLELNQEQGTEKNGD